MTDRDDLESLFGAASQSPVDVERSWAEHMRRRADRRVLPKGSPTRGRRLPRMAIILFTATLGVVVAAAATGGFGTSPDRHSSVPGHKSTARPGPGPATSGLPAFSSAVTTAVNATDVSIEAASDAEASEASVSEATAESTALSELPPSSTALAGQLVILTTSQYPDGILAWAFQTRPSDGYGAPSGGPAGNTAPPPRNFRVDFVDAKSGAWIEAVVGYSSGLSG